MTHLSLKEREKRLPATLISFLLCPWLGVFSFCDDGTVVVTFVVLGFQSRFSLLFSGKISVLRIVF